MTKSFTFLAVRLCVANRNFSQSRKPFERAIRPARFASGSASRRKKGSFLHVQFVVIDLDIKRTEQQQELVKSYYRGYIPHVTVLDAAGKVVYNSAGEVEESTISPILDASLKDPK